MFPIVQMISCKVCKINTGYDVRKSPIFPAESFLADFTVDIEFRACFQRHLRNSDLDSGNMPVEPENICCRIVPRRWTTVFRIVPPPRRERSSRIRWFHRVFRPRCPRNPSVRFCVRSSVANSICGNRAPHLPELRNLQRKYYNWFHSAASIATNCLQQHYPWKNHLPGKDTSVCRATDIHPESEWRAVVFSCDFRQI